MVNQVYVGWGDDWMGSWVVVGRAVSATLSGKSHFDGFCPFRHSDFWVSRPRRPATRPRRGPPRAQPNLNAHGPAHFPRPQCMHRRETNYARINSTCVARRASRFHFLGSGDRRSSAISVFLIVGARRRRRCWGQALGRCRFRSPMPSHRRNFPSRVLPNPTRSPPRRPRPRSA